MKTTLEPGLAITKRITIDKPRTIDFLGEDLRVYATPELVRDIEQTCLEFLLEHADPGENSVGTGIQVSHGAATPLGMTVTITATVAKVEGRHVTFDVVVADDFDEVSRGSHGRFVVAVDKLKERVAAKVAKAKAG